MSSRTRPKLYQELKESTSHSISEFCDPLPRVAASLNHLQREGNHEEILDHFLVGLQYEYVLDTGRGIEGMNARMEKLDAV